MKLHKSSRRPRPFWPSFPQQHAQRNVRSTDPGLRLSFVTPWGTIDSITSLSSVLSAPMEITPLSTVWTRWLTFSDNAMEGRLHDNAIQYDTIQYKKNVLDYIETFDRIKYASCQFNYFCNDSSFIRCENGERQRLHPDFNPHPQKVSAASLQKIFEVVLLTIKSIKGAFHPFRFSWRCRPWGCKCCNAGVNFKKL